MGNPVREAVDAPNKSRFLGIDGLRGIASLMVLAHHCWWFGGQYEWPRFGLGGTTFAPTHLLFYGYSGVELFFVLSGFCLAYPVLRKPDQPFQFWRYAAKRAYRILPPYYGSLLLFLGLFYVLSAHEFRLFGATTARLTMPTAKQFISAVFLISVYFNTSFWTLVLEWKWYLVLPALLWLRRRTTVGIALAATGGLSVVARTAILGTDGKVDWLVGNLLFYLPLFGLGILAAETTARGEAFAPGRLLVRYCRWGLLGACALVAAWVPAEPDMTLCYARILPFGLLYFFLLITALHDPLLARVFSSKVLVGVGAFSYSLYLVHLPIVHCVYGVTCQFDWAPSTCCLFSLGVVLPGCVLFAFFFYRVAERPFLRGLPTEGRRPTPEAER